MKHVCAWCNVLLTEDDHEAADGRNISHGICESCSKKLVSEPPVEMKNSLDVFKTPVLSLNNDGVMLSGNEIALNIINKSVGEISLHRAGEVLECVFSSEPGGCTKTSHCGSCTVRQLLKKTHETGVGYSDVPAYLFIKDSDVVKKMKYHLTTEYFESMILLQINAVSLESILEYDEAVKEMKRIFVESE